MIFYIVPFQEEFGGEIAGWRDGIITFDSVADFFISQIREELLKHSAKIRKDALAELLDYLQ